jgi:hypothetical protein
VVRRDFATTCHAVARTLGGHVVAIVAPDSTPSFIRPSIRKPSGRTVDLLCHRDLPVFAFAGHGSFATFTDDVDLRQGWPMSTGRRGGPTGYPAPTNVGVSSQRRPSRRRPFFFGVRQPHCLKKNGVPDARQVSRSWRAHSGSMGR